MYATAAPDFPDIIQYKKTYCPFGKPHYFRFQQGKRQGFFLLPNISSGTIEKYYKKDLYISCHLIEQKLFTMLRYKHYNAAVFYLGIIAHYIGDSACFPHVIEYLSDTEFCTSCSDMHEILLKFYMINTEYREEVSKRTCQKNSLYKFFKVDLTKFDVLELVDAKNAVILTAFNTFNDSLSYDRHGKYNASYMLNSYEKTMKNKWGEFNQGWHHNHQKDHAYFYLMKIQESLQVTIQNIIRFFNYIIQNV